MVGSITGHALLRCARGRCLPVVRSRGRPLSRSVAARTMRPCRVYWTRRVVARAAETAATARIVKNEQHVSTKSVFHRTMTSERAGRSRCRCSLQKPCDLWMRMRLATRPHADTGFSPGPARRLSPDLRRTGNQAVPCAPPRSVAHGAVDVFRRRPRAASDFDPAASPPRSEARRSFRIRGFHPSLLAGRCSAPVSLGVATSGATSSFDFCRKLRSWARALPKAGSSPTHCRAGARHGHRSLESGPWNAGRCRTSGSRGARLPVQRPRMRAA